MFVASFPSSDFKSITYYGTTWPQVKNSHWEPHKKLQTLKYVSANTINIS